MNRRSGVWPPVALEKRMHYMWISFFLDQSGLDRLDKDCKRQT